MIFLDTLPLSVGCFVLQQSNVPDVIPESMESDLSIKKTISLLCHSPFNRRVFDFSNQERSPKPSPTPQNPQKSIFKQNG
jgi:hypothetical protein